jgi:hypothetical protein
MFTWVGFASTPRLLSSRQNCHAVRPRELALSLMTTALNSPRPTDLLDEWRAQGTNATAELLAESFRALREALIDQDIQRGHRHRTGKRIPVHVSKGVSDERGEGAPAVGAPVLARFNAEHYVLVREHGGYGVHAPREGFAEEKHIRADALVLYAQ